MRSFFKRKKALESSHSQLSNAFFRLKNDAMEQKLWNIIVSRAVNSKRIILIFKRIILFGRYWCREVNAQFCVSGLRYGQEYDFVKFGVYHFFLHPNDTGGRVPHIVRTPPAPQARGSDLLCAYIYIHIGVCQKFGNRGSCSKKQKMHAENHFVKVTKMLRTYSKSADLTKWVNFVNWTNSWRGQKMSQNLTRKKYLRIAKEHI